MAGNCHEQGESMAESNRYFAFPFHTKIQMQETATHPEEVPLQEIVFKNIQNFTREDFDQAKKDLESSKGGEVKGFKYTYFSSYSPEKNCKYEQAKQQKAQNV
ncbi:hypothetical protein AC249_AIPGENE9001 [Exaiptasia diaphana]|nr:hypothetical protein AC249_AIPGENE9001 [Exaiptasia diaphana]